MKKVYYMGIDQHKKSSTIHVRDGNGKTVVRTSIMHDDLGKLRSLIKNLDGQVEAAVETTGFYWWMVRELRKAGANVHLVHARALRLIFISKNKTDKLDAERLSKLLWMGEIPESYIPTEQEMQWRELIGTRKLLIKMRTQFNNRIKQLFAKLNEELPVNGGLWRPKSIEKLRMVNLGGELDHCLKQLINGMEKANECAYEITERIGERAMQDNLCREIDEIKGFNELNSATIRAYICEFSRFANRRKIGSYVGLVPRVNMSADNERFGHIDKMGPSEVRKALVQAVLVLKKTKEVQVYYSYMLRRMSKQKAIIAMARRLIVGMRAAHLKGEAFEPGKCFKVPRHKVRRVIEIYPGRGPKAAT